MECSYPFDPKLEFEKEEGGEPARYGSAFHLIMAWLLLNELGLTKEKAKLKRAQFTKVVDQAVKKYKLPPSSAAPLPGHVRGSFGVLSNWLQGKNPWGRDFLKEFGKKAMVVERAYAIKIRPGIRPEVRKIDLPTDEGHVYDDVRPDEQPGTVDLLIGPLVLDHKTGSAETFESPFDKAQLRSLAAIPLALHPAEPPIVGVLHADRRGLPAIYTDEPEPKEVHRHLALVDKALRRIGDGSMRPGPWCPQCPAQEVCPAQHGELLTRTREIASKSMTVAAFLDGPDSDRSIMTVEDIGKMHLLFHKLSALLEVGRGEIKNWVAEHPGEFVVRPDGKELALIERSQERLSKSAFIDVLGKVKGERELARLRKLGVLKATTRMELHAVKPGG